METKTRVVIYSRPEDIDQLIKYSKTRHYQVVNVFEKTNLSDRMEWFEITDFIKSNNIQKVVVSDCSTLSRKVYDFLSMVNDLCEIGVSVHLMNNKIDSLLSNGKVNPTFRVVCRVLNEFDIIQKSRSRERLMNGYISFRHNGGQVGRKSGYRKTTLQYQKEYPREIELLREGTSLKKCKSITGTSINTIRKLKELFC